VEEEIMEVLVGDQPTPQVMEAELTMVDLLVEVQLPVGAAKYLS
jgi:hypothetical protein